MKNRNGDFYEFVRIDENTFTIQGDLKYWRYGGREGQQKMDCNELGFVDPSGGPFLGIGSTIQGQEIKSIRVVDDKILFGV